MIRAIVVDDEAYIRDKIKANVEQYFGEDIKIVDEAESVASATKKIKEKKTRPSFFGYSTHRWNKFRFVRKDTRQKF